jgi:hypothetical protein
MKSVPERSFTVMIMASALLCGVVGAHAGPCAAQIAQLQKIAKSRTPTLRQNPSGDLHHQPTARDVENAQNQAKAEAAAAFDRAQRADAQGDAAKCTQAIADLKKLYTVN